MSGAILEDAPPPAAAAAARAGLLSSLALAASVVLLVGAIAFWAWQWLAPAPRHVLPAGPRDPVAAIAASGLLGATPRGAAPAAPATLSGDVRLLGIFADTRGGGYALFRLPAGPKLVREGDEIARGSTLVAVHTLQIRIRDGAGERDIALRAQAVGAPAAPARATQPAGRARSASAQCAPPAGFHGDVLRLNAELLQGLTAQPDALRDIVVPVTGGMSLRDGSGFAQMLGMKAGDVVKVANGIPLASVDDVSAAVLVPLTRNQPVRLSGIHDGRPREILLLNAGTCP